VNHRLGIFGHLHLGWTGDPAFAESATAGLLDLNFALDWLRHNVSAFGGDPDNITVSGGSRGASRVAALLSTTAPEPPFQRAIMMSPPRALRASPAGPQEAAEAVLRHVDVPWNRLDLLAKIPVAQLLDAQASVRASLRHVFQPTTDNIPIEQRCYADVAAGATPQISLMIGSTLSETARMFDADPANWDGIDDAELTRRCSRIVRYDVSELVSEYRRTQPTESARRIAIAVTTDALYRFPTLALASARSRTAPTYAYLFTGGTGSHSEDVLYFFDNLSCAILVSQTAASQRLAEQASTAWITFCHQGTPNVPDIGRWPLYTATDRKAMIFGNPARVVTDPFASRRSHWERWASRTDIYSVS
jgi:para-nitrobenzyl esterase